MSSHGHRSMDFLAEGPSSDISLFSTALKSTRWASSLNTCDDVGFLVKGKRRIIKQALDRL